MKPTNLARLVAIAALLALCVALPQARAAAPGLIHHQGFLTDESGTPINGIVEIAFSIYDQEIDGSEVWSEGPISVTATDGLF